jgi:hypothetical protein
MKNPAPKTVRLMQVAADSRDSLRRLAARIAAAGEDPQLHEQTLAAGHQVANTHGIFCSSRRAQDARKDRLVAPRQPSPCGRLLPRCGEVIPGLNLERECA